MRTTVFNAVKDVVYAQDKDMIAWKDIQYTKQCIQFSFETLNPKSLSLAVEDLQEDADRFLISDSAVQHLNINPDYKDPYLFKAQTDKICEAVKELHELELENSLEDPDIFDDEHNLHKFMCTLKALRRLLISLGMTDNRYWRHIQSTTGILINVLSVTFGLGEFGNDNNTQIARDQLKNYYLASNS